MLRYAITDRMRLSRDELERQAKLLDHAARWAADGIDFIQLREKDMEAGALVDLSRKLLTILRSHDPAPRLLINARSDVAIVAGADGVHLTSAPGELTPTQTRLLYAAADLPAPIISVSCHTVAQVVEARDMGASLLLFGPVFEKRIGDRLIMEGAGLDLLHAACAKAAPTPVLALGGVTEINASECLAAGAAGIAAIRLFSK
jgi:thiamine-phosphate pyrophosphorylase